MHLWKDIGRWIVVPTIIAVPITWYFMNHWLQHFAYRINFKWASLVFAFIVALLIAIITVSYQTIRAARANPADSLRYE
jgi:putative ABC transport system permease protein